MDLSGRPIELFVFDKNPRPMSDSLEFLIELPVEASDFRADVLRGLSGEQKSIPPKYFYDEAGADLFVQITRTPEYYPTRIETALLKRVAPELAFRLGGGASLIEPGSGAAQKIQTLLGELSEPFECILMDISAEQLKASGRAVQAAFPGLRVGAVSGDFTGVMPRPGDIFSGDGKRLCFFPGSTIGNFAPFEQVELLRSFKSVLRPGDAILLGADGVKDAGRLDAAYNDASGLTAAFNLNLLTRMQTELRANLDRAAFDHLSFYNPVCQRIEMHILARRSTQIEIDGQCFKLAVGETIHTENSWKFTPDSLSVLADKAGMQMQEIWCSETHSFYLALLEVH